MCDGVTSNSLTKISREFYKGLKLTSQRPLALNWVPGLHKELIERGLQLRTRPCSFQFSTSDAAQGRGCPGWGHGSNGAWGK
jgi:hypothetical protein